MQVRKQQLKLDTDGIVRDLDDLYRKLNGRIVLIKGNHDVLDDSIYRMAFADVVDRMSIDELKLLLVHDPETATLRPGERMIYGHYHRGIPWAPSTFHPRPGGWAEWTAQWRPPLCISIKMKKLKSKCLKVC